MKLQHLIFVFSILILASCSKDLEPEFELETIEAETRQLKLDNWTPISQCDASQLVIFIDPTCVGLNWETGITSAVNAYNATPTSLNFTITYDASDPADISIDCADFADNGLYGLGEWPDLNNKVGTQIFLNSGTLSGLCTKVPDCFFQSVAMHEIGHNLGLGHNEDEDGSSWQVGAWQLNADGTFTALGGVSTGTHIAGTAAAGESDCTSIFNETANCSSSCTFNSNDIKALQDIYPAMDKPKCECPEIFPACACEEDINITFPTTYQSGCIPPNAYFQICAYGWAGEPAPNVNYLWTSTGSVVLDDTDQRCVYIDVGTTGGTVSVWATNSACGTNSTHRTIEICQDTGGGTGGGGIPGKTKPIQ